MTTQQLSNLVGRLTNFLPGHVEAETTVHKYLGAFRQIESVVEKFSLEQLAGPDGRAAVLAMIDADQVLSQKPYHRDQTYSAVLGKVQLMLSNTGSVQKEVEANLIPKTCLNASLLAKPFTILTGNSGTGKTRSAEDLAAMFRDADDLELAKNVVLVAVGADWTDSRNVVGYVNHLREAKMAGAVDSRPVYQSTPVLDLLLEASKPGRESLPHFLILDEMNLSHVERYFADFLSAMEARSGAIRFHEEGAGNTKAETGDLKTESGTPEADFRLPRFEGDTVGVPRSLPYPQNLFVIGTVNVDETTYMFSPKVLDRAHVIEFEVDRGEVGKFLDDPKPLQPVPRAAAGQAEAFLELSLRARGLQEPPLPELPPAVKTAVNKHLLEVLEILQNGRFEFAFRTAKEVVAYLKVSCELAADKAAWEAGKWKSDLDDEILQKILPKLSGSKRRIEALLVRLARYCETGVVHKIEESTPAAYQSSPVKRADAAKCKFARSHGKLCDMIDAVRRAQFVSFIH